MRAIVVVLVVGWGAPAHAVEKHPDVLPGEEGCERWLGGSSGNDRSVRLNLVLCRDGRRAHGRVQCSSLVSGWNVREVIGTIDGDVVELRDVRVVEERPENGWRFCTIDRWALRQDGMRMEGTYDSAACDDHATVWLEKMPDQDAGAGASPGPTPRPAPRPTPPPAPAPAPAPEPEDRSCRCGGGGGSGLGALFLLALLATRPSGGRRSAGRWRHGRRRRRCRSRS